LKQAEHAQKSKKIIQMTSLLHLDGRSSIERKAQRALMPSHAQSQIPSRINTIVQAVAGSSIHKRLHAALGRKLPRTPPNECSAQNMCFPHRTEVCPNATPLSLSLTRRSSLRRQLHVEATSSPSSNASHADTQTIAVVKLAVSIAVQETGMTRWQSLRAEADDLEDVDGKAVGCVVQLLVDTLPLVLLVDGLVNEGLDEGLRVPVREAVHDCVELFVRVDWSVASFFILEGRVRVDCCFCLRY
jgi:hypothetical protein